MCSEGGARGNWTSQQVIGEIDRLLDLLNGEDLHVLPAESIGDDLKGLTRIGNRVAAESSRRLRRLCLIDGRVGAGLAALAVQSHRRISIRAG